MKHIIYPLALIGLMFDVILGIVLIFLTLYFFIQEQYLFAGISYIAQRVTHMAWDVDIIKRKLKDIEIQ